MQNATKKYLIWKISLFKKYMSLSFKTLWVLHIAIMLRGIDGSVHITDGVEDTGLPSFIKGIDKDLLLFKKNV